MKVMTMFYRKCGAPVRAALAGALAVTVLLAAPSPVMAQDNPNPGALTFTGGVDFPTIYFFRGIRQETDADLTAMWPYGDLGIALFSGTGGLKSVGVNVGVWNSVQTGSSGTDGPSAHGHYEEDFYATLGLGFGGGFTVGATSMALTSPNLMFNTVKEFQVKVSKAHMLAPYAFLAWELTDDGQADVGSHKGSYSSSASLRAGHSRRMGRRSRSPSSSVWAWAGTLRSAHGRQFRRVPAENSTFGFFDIGGLVTVPLKGIASKFGAWNIHGGVDVLFLGHGTKFFNVDPAGERNGNKVIGLFGISITS